MCSSSVGKREQSKKKRDEVKGLWPETESNIHCQKPLVGASQEVIFDETHLSVLAKGLRSITCCVAIESVERPCAEENVSCKRKKRT